MLDDQHLSFRGGCQCGAVRYAISGAFENPHICHCRMCQKAFGNYFAALVGAKKKDFQWTRGRPGIFRSSSVVERCFCRDCGTPLSIADNHSDRIAISIGSLDDPGAVTPAHQYGIESRLPAFEHLHGLEGSRTEDDVPPEMMVKLKSLQHPDGEEQA
ncbi:MAG: GFA family protein [Aestuariivirga sp.]